ncbi:MAG: hypothetical protein IPK19_30875 [Chloroflexi bacterium]|nr:hypothetical protein [Chloroflexota bacterium]
MKKFRIVLAAVVLTVGLVATSVSAQNSAGEGGRGRLQDRPRVAVNLLRSVVDIVSNQTGLAPLELLQQIRSTDQTIAEIITANGGSVDAVSAEVIAAITNAVNEAVANGRLTQERADEVLSNLPQNVDQALSSDPQRGGRVDRGVVDLLRDRALGRAVEEATGLSPREVLEQVRSGKTLGEVIAENGGEPQAVIDSVLASATERLAQAVENGRLTQEQADERLAQLEVRLNDLMNGTLRERVQVGSSL